MRDKAHYLKMLDNNPTAGVGYTLAASCVFAARHGMCGGDDHGSEEWKQIARDLKSKYGEHLSADEVRGLIESA